jgi:hypothetical protein
MPHIRHSIEIVAPADRVHPLVSSGPGFSQWWAADVSSVGPPEIVELAFFKRATVYRLRPIRIAPSRQAEWLCESGKEWDNTRLLFDLTPHDSHTLLRFTHADWRAETDYFVSCNTVWGELMFRLKAAAEGKAPGPLFSADGMAY